MSRYIRGQGRPAVIGRRWGGKGRAAGAPGVHTRWPIVGRGGADGCNNVAYTDYIRVCIHETHVRVPDGPACAWLISLLPFDAARTHGRVPAHCNRPGGRPLVEIVSTSCEARPVHPATPGSKGPSSDPLSWLTRAQSGLLLSSRSVSRGAHGLRNN